MDGTEAIKIKVNKGGKRAEYSFFDPATYFEIKNIRVEEVDGKESESATTYSNFKNQDGIIMPFTIQTSDQGMGASTITISTVAFNPVVDQKVFEMPGK